MKSWRNTIDIASCWFTAHWLRGAEMILKRHCFGDRLRRLKIEKDE